MKIRTILATKGAHVVTLRPEQTVQDAVALLAQHNIGGLVVVNADGQVAGIFTERDVVRGAARTPGFFEKDVAQVMTRTLIVGSPQDDLLSVLHTMTEKRFRHLPVLDRGRLAGIVSIGDVIKALLDEYQGELETLETQIIEG